MELMTVRLVPSERLRWTVHAAGAPPLTDVVRASLSREDRAVVARQYDELERREIGESVLERFTAIAEDLEHRQQRDSPA